MVTASSAASHKVLKTPQDFEELLDGIDHVLLDCDGVIWLEGELLPHAKRTLDLFRDHNIGVAFVSNNATSTRKTYAERFKKLGIDVSHEQIFTSGTASASYLKNTLLPSLPQDRQGVYLIGQKAIEEEMREQGLKWSGGTDPDENELMPPQDFTVLSPKPDVGVVLASFDMHYNYKKMCKAFNYLTHNDGCVLLLSNEDAEVPLKDGITGAGEGAMAAPLKLAAKGPIIVAGKPNQPLMDAVLKQMDFKREKTLMIGDTLGTDITFGNNGNVRTLLVLSGMTQMDDIPKDGKEAKPDYICDSLGQIADKLKELHEKRKQ